mgnify:FL=1
MQPVLSFGRGDLMAVAAVRYCLGRMSYIVGDCADWLCEQWPNIEPKMRIVIERDIREAVKRDTESREGGREHHPLGMDMDREQWMRMLAMIDAAALAGTAPGATGG